MDFINAVKTHSCRLCHKSFVRRYNLKRHLESRHGDERSTFDRSVDHYEPMEKVNKHFDDNSSNKNDSQEDITESEDSESSTDDSENEESDGTDPSSSEELEDNPVYNEWVDQANESTQEMWAEKYEKYINEGMDDQMAEQKALMKTRWMRKRIFFDTYMTFLTYFIRLRDNDIHQEIVDDVDEKIDKGLHVRTALRRAMVKHKSKFDGLFEQVEEPEEDETDAQATDSDDHSDDDIKGDDEEDETTEGKIMD